MRIQRTAVTILPLRCGFTQPVTTRAMLSTLFMGTRAANLRLIEFLCVRKRIVLKRSIAEGVEVISRRLIPRFQVSSVFTGYPG